MSRSLLTLFTFALSVALALPLAAAADGRASAPAEPPLAPVRADGWTELQSTALFRARRQGRYFRVDLKAPHRVISTSADNGGERTQLSALVNHQSMESWADARWVDRVLQRSKRAYHELIAAEVGVEPEQMALMGTAANMQLLAHRREAFAPPGGEPLVVDVYATAGVRGNALRAGDGTAWYETADGNRRVPDEPQAPAAPADNDGTINLMVLVSQPVAAGAMNKLQLIATEAKSAALAELAVASRSSRHLATGTGTDQLIIASPLQGDAPALESGSGHLKLGELVGTAVRRAVRQALVWQNGLPASQQASLYGALGRFGLTRENFVERLLPHLPESERQQARRNPGALTQDNRVVAAAYALAGVLDRYAYRTLSPHSRTEALRDFAAQAAVAVSARPDRYSHYWRQLQPAVDGDGAAHETQAIDLFVRALAVGWLDKWPEQARGEGDTKTVALLHLDPQLGDLDGNTRLVEQAMRQAAAAGADWVLTPELALSGYRFDLAIGADWIQPAPDRWTAELQRLADELDVVLFLSHLEQGDDGQRYNTLFVIDHNGEIVGRHRKIQTIAQSEGWSTRGERPTLVAVDGRQVGLLICADAYHQQHAGALAQQGAELILSSASWAPGQYGPGDSWRARSKETGLPLFVSNRTGVENRPEFEGVPPRLDLRQAISVVAHAGEHQIEHQHSGNSVLLVEWDLATQRLVRQRSFEVREPGS